MHVATIKCLFEYYGDNVNAIIAGDYNFLGITFSRDNTGLVLNDHKSAVVDVVFDSFSIYNLFQYNALRNPYDNTLDLIFSNFNLLSVDLCSSPLVQINKPHPTINIYQICKKKKIIHII